MLVFFQRLWRKRGTNLVPLKGRPLPIISFTENIQRHVKLPTKAVEGSTVAEAINNFFGSNAIAKSYVLDEQGSLRKHMNIFVDNTAIHDRIGLSDSVSTESTIYVIQALSGG